MTNANAPRKAYRVDTFLFILWVASTGANGTVQYTMTASRDAGTCSISVEIRYAGQEGRHLTVGKQVLYRVRTCP